MKNITRWICIARTGTFADSGGKPHTFTEHDLENIRAAYNPEQSEAPLVFGHPKDNEPAYGWVHALKREGKRLFAQFAQVPDIVRKLVEDGRYRYVSMSLAPDKKRLLHVGLLGAAAPAIDGLGAVSLNTGGLIINFTGPELEFQPDDGGNMNPEELQRQITELQRKIDALQGENEKLKGELAAAQKGKEEADGKTAETAAEFAAFKGKLVSDRREARVLALIDSGKLAPASKEETLSFAAALAEVKKPVNFSAPGGKTEEISAEERYFRELEARESDPRFLNFAAMASPPAHAGRQEPGYSPADITSKL